MFQGAYSKIFNETSTPNLYRIYLFVLPFVRVKAQDSAKLEAKFFGFRAVQVKPENRWIWHFQNCLKIEILQKLHRCAIIILVLTAGTACTLYFFFFLFSLFKGTNSVNPPNCRYRTQPALLCLQNRKLDHLLYNEISPC